MHASCDCPQLLSIFAPISPAPPPFLPLAAALQVYSAIVSTFTLKTREPPSKWVLASTALLLQDDLA
jgi:hypothetical protein